MSHSVSDLRGFLAGTWHISRRIGDVRQGIVGRLTGFATFARSPDGLTYDEKGDLRFGTYLGRATRRYRLVMDRPGSGEMRQADGSPFHSLDLTSGIAEILHQCARDRYCGRYRVLDGNRFTVIWHVTGPRKHYRLATLHSRTLLESGRSVR